VSRGLTCGGSAPLPIFDIQSIHQVLRKNEKYALKENLGLTASPSSATRRLIIWPRFPRPVLKNWEYHQLKQKERFFWRWREIKCFSTLVMSETIRWLTGMPYPDATFLLTYSMPAARVVA
jgi:hypothetical protein